MFDKLFNNIYKDTTVLVTGHTGFKGSWLIYWLEKMDAKVIGYSLKMDNPNHYSLLNTKITSIIADINDTKKLDETFSTYKPDIVFHLAAQALVRYSYTNPIETYETNVMGTLKVFEACKNHNVKAIVNITSDKAYENKEISYSYKEDDPFGGYDPYSSSKACSEILTNSYRNSYFNLNEYKITHSTLLASCRAGNVIGGGDWAQDRLLPDIIKAIQNKENMQIRNPLSTRPWQHVLEPLSGYLLVGQKLLEKNLNFATGWNFGPKINESITVKQIVETCKKHWSCLEYNIYLEEQKLHEAKLLQLDCTKAYEKLKWINIWDTEETIEKTILWYKKLYLNDKVNTYNDLQEYIKSAKIKGLTWTKN